MAHEDHEDKLLQAARKVQKLAHAPYSGFKVGAALLDEAGRVHSGCNVENAAYPQSQCAEASAIGALIAAGAREIRAVVVVGDGGEPVTPCGGCRQRLREFAALDTPVIVADQTVVKGRYTLGGLLPHSFGPGHLKKP
jgi:cytidine deaminase